MSFTNNNLFFSLYPPICFHRPSKLFSLHLSRQFNLSGSLLSNVPPLKQEQILNPPLSLSQINALGMYVHRQEAMWHLRGWINFISPICPVLPEYCDMDIMEFIREMISWEFCCLYLTNHYFNTGPRHFASRTSWLSAYLPRWTSFEISGKVLMCFVLLVCCVVSRSWSNILQNIKFINNSGKIIWTSWFSSRQFDFLDIFLDRQVEVNS